MSARVKTRPHPQHRVLHVDLGMEYRGGQRQVLYLAAEQVRAGMDVCVFSPRGAPILVLAERAGIPTRMLPAQYDFDPRNVVSLVLACSRDAIIHTHDAQGRRLWARWCRCCARMPVWCTRAESVMNWGVAGVGGNIGVDTV